MAQISRNDEEQTAFDALVEVIHLNSNEYKEVARWKAAHIERELLARGYAITKIPTVDFREVTE